MKNQKSLFFWTDWFGKNYYHHYVVNKFKNNRKVHSIENPIEYINPDIVQISSKDESDKINILKYILRQDPDVIVVGEIRENNFAKLLFDSAVTGHLVFQLFIQRMFLILQRLKMLGVELKNLSESIDLLLNQRLIPKKCEHCNGKGCNTCYFTGKRGYVTVFEALIVTDNLKRDISINKSISFIKEKYKQTESYIDPSIRLRELLDNSLISEDQYYTNLHSF